MTIGSLYDEALHPWRRRKPFLEEGHSSRKGESTGFERFIP